MIVGGMARLRRFSCAFGVSVIAIAAASAASAQCSPDPTAANGITNCTGTDTDGLTVNTSSTQVFVATGATVLSGSSAAAIALNSGYLTVNGLVDGAGKPGVTVTAGPPMTGICDPYAFPSYNSSCSPGSTITYDPGAGSSITIAAGGTITGSQALLMSRDSGNASGFVSVTLVNGGTLTGTAGPAIVNTVANNSMLSIINLATGSIGGITGAISSLDNAGLIDGGANSAVAISGTSLSTGGFINSGRIVSSGGAPTFSATGALYLYLTNSAGATIGGGAVALSVGGAFNLTNAGTINGSVVSTAAAGQDSTIDTRQGIINGDLTLGAGNDALRAVYDPATGQLSSITGTVDGGGGTDTLSIAVNHDTTFGAVILPTNFEVLGFDLANNAIATLSSNFATSGGIEISGNGTVISQADLATSGPAVTTVFGSSPSFTNQGHITATLDSDEIAVASPMILTNSGTITANGGAGARASSIVNSGDITATATAANASYGTLDNTGTIRSTGGIGASITGMASYIASTNSGTITGATIGVDQTTSTLVNTGTISGDTTGVALNYSATLINAAGGIVTGGADAVLNAGNSARVVNAGTLNGTVRLGSAQQYDFSNDVFVDAGGVVNGAIQLGGGDDLLVVDFAADPARPLAGATGGVDAGAGYDVLRYRVNTNASASLALVPGFEGLGYELDNEAALTLTAAAPITTTIGLTGNGTVTLNGAISTADRALIDTTVLTVAQLTESSAGPAQALSIINNGNLGLVTTQPTYGASAGLFAINASTANVVNNGTITVTNVTGDYYPAGGIFNGTSVINAGTISLTGGTAIINTQMITNSGMITDSAGSGGTGVTGFATLANSGTIRVDGDAAQVGLGYGANILNSGTIESRLGKAITLSYSAILTNTTSGTIKGPTAVNVTSGGTIINRGSIVGDIATSSPYSSATTTYVVDGGTLAGGLTFGSGDDFLIVSGTGGTGISGTANGGGGINTLGHVLTTSGAVSLDANASTINFENRLVQAEGAGTTATVAATDIIAGSLYVNGDGAIINQATIAGAVKTGIRYVSGQPVQYGIGTMASFTNNGSIAKGVAGSFGSFTNNGSVTAAEQAFSLDLRADAAGGVISIANSGQLASTASHGGAAVSAAIRDSGTPMTISVANSGAISATLANDATTAGVTGLGINIFGINSNPPSAATVSITNTATGTVTGGGTSGVGIGVGGGATSAVVTLDNAGVITSGADIANNLPLGTAIALQSTLAANIHNTGAITGAVLLGAGDDVIDNAGTITGTVRLGAGNDIFIQRASGIVHGTIDGGSGFDMLMVEAPGGGSVRADQVVNFEQISQTGTAADIITYSGDFNVASIALDSGALAVAAGQSLSTTSGTTIVGGDGGATVINAGTIAGAIQMGAGDDTVVNTGTIIGSVALGAGNDSFIQRASGIVHGMIDGGDGTDTLVVDATGGGSLRADQVIDFEQISQTGTVADIVTYSGDFNVTSIALNGGTLAVAAGQSLSTTSGATIVGGDEDAAVINAGTIAGAVLMGTGDDAVVNTGTIIGSVALGAGNDSYTEGFGSGVAGPVDGGDGTDTYRVLLAGDRTGIGARTNFEQLGVDGSGTLALALDQNYQVVEVNGANLVASLGAFTIGRVDGGGAAEQVTIDGDIPAAALGGGNDALMLATATPAGRYDGGDGNDTFRPTVPGPITLTGSLTNFETFVLPEGALTVTGTLGNSGNTLSLASDGAQSLTLARGGTIAGIVRMGDGGDSFRLAAGGILAGTVAGGAGVDTATVELPIDYTLPAGGLAGFERLVTEGTGKLTIAGGQAAFGAMNLLGDVTVASDASVTTGQLTFGPADNRLVIAGHFAGSINGGAGNDSIDITGGNAAAPVAFTNVTDVETLRMSAGFATVSGTAAFNTLAIAGGRLVGLAGSTISTPNIMVGAGATFGSAGTVNGNIAVSGTLSPGASPGTMTVNGNVALAAGSLSLFEITSAVSDKLLVNGTVSIAPGATLQLTADQAITPGRSLDLIVASGGISGSYTSIVKPASLFGLIIQEADKISLLGEFLNDPTFSPQVRRSIAYMNDVLTSGRGSAALLAAVPRLALADGASNQTAFAQLTPEAYASARQLTLEHGLQLADTGRGAGFAAHGQAPGLFTFGAMLTDVRTLDGGTQGTSRAHMSGYGLLGGIGWGGEDWSIGAFAGYVDSRQTLSGLGARTTADGVIAGLHARWRRGELGLKATVAYDGSRAETRRVLPDAPVSSRYGLHGWTGDISLDYSWAISGDWTIRPSVGATAIRTIQGRTTETGSAFALDLRSDRGHAVFVDGALTFAGGTRAKAAVRPYLSIGLRYQVDGRTPSTLAAIQGGDFGLEAAGARRAPVLATAALGADVILSSRLTLFGAVGGESGAADRRFSARGGLRWAF